jgi:hypothetical protein
MARIRDRFDKNFREKGICEARRRMYSVQGIQRTMAEGW